MPAFTKILVANRGEIAVRVFRTLRELGIGTVAVYSEVDRERLHVAVADEAYLLGPGPGGGVVPARGPDRRGRAPRGSRGDPSRLRLPRRERRLRAPGRGGRARRGSARRRRRSRRWARRSRPASACALRACPSCPGRREPATSVEDVLAAADEIGYPIAVKASAGGGGKGLARRARADEVERAFETARREGEAYFADSAVYVERYLDDPRHVEVQILADAHGNVIHLGERDCTIQRRHQKLVEETPSPAVDAELRARIGAIAVDAARAVGYRSAGTIEGLLDCRRLVLLPRDEHARAGRAHRHRGRHGHRHRPRADPRSPPGEPLSVAQDDVVLRGHAIECRINAEDVARGVPPVARADHGLPRAGGHRSARRLRRAGRRRDLGSLRPADREAHRARRRPRARAAADAARARGVRHRGADDAPRLPPRAPRRRRASSTAARAAASSSRRSSRSARRSSTSSCLIGDERSAVGGRTAGRRRDARAASSPSRSTAVGTRFALHAAEPPWAELARRHRERSKGLVGDGDGRRHEPDAGDGALGRGRATATRSQAGELICVVEAMKMENEIVAHRDGVVAELARRAGRAGRERSGHLRDRDRVSAPMRCADLSELAGESLGATATTAEHWLLVEVPGTWPRDVSDAATVCPSAHATPSQAWLERTPASRLLFVRRPGRARASAELAFVVRAAESRTPRCGGSSSSTPDELADVDLARGGEPIDSPLVLVCGHGTRDACCALRGTAVYGALARASRATTSSGSRRTRVGIASRRTSSCCPRASSSAASRPTSAPRVVARALAGRIELEHYRGRTCVLRRASRRRSRASARREGLDAVVGSPARRRSTATRPVRELATVGSTRPSSRRRRADACRRAAAPSPEPQAAFSARLV